MAFSWLDRLDRRTTDPEEPEREDRPRAPGRLSSTSPEARTAAPGRYSPGSRSSAWRGTLQHRRRRGKRVGEEQEVAAAGAGLSGTTGSLPYLERLQRAFGRHDLDGVRAHFGDAAARANREIGSLAYTIGSEIAFADGSPDLHTVAHEAAHVIQQRAGTLPAGRVGQPGDALERHADDVADRVVRGDSAEALLDRVAPAAGGARGGAGPIANAPVQKQELQTAHAGLAERAAEIAAEEVEHHEKLAKIQGKAMFALLPALEALPQEVRTDYGTGQQVGGPRLVVAMRAVASGADWLTFATGHNAELAALPPDQISDIMSYLGASQDARYFRADEFGGNFDGAVDPGAGTITLFFRVKIEAAPGARFGAHQPGTDGWQQETQQALATFKTEFKQVVEATWRGTIRPAHPMKQVKPFHARVEVIVVEGGEHATFYVHGLEASGRSNMGDGVGNLKIGDNEESHHHDTVVDPTGRHPEEVDTTQVPSTHEFGHALGLNHPHCPGSSNNCYGVTAEERGSVMGSGHELRVVQRGGVIRHNDFEPFIKIAAKWGEDLFPGALDGLNDWTGG